MNIYDFNIMNTLYSSPFINQRLLATQCGYSLGLVNRSLKALIENGYLDTDTKLTKKALELFDKGKPKNAIILAAGFGMRMVPINTETPKGCIQVYGEALIERLIEQLHEAGILDIWIVVGFMKEQYEYLMDKYGVRLIVNPDYASKNNLHSLKLASKYISNSYILPCDVWFRRNPFKSHELYSWYMVGDQPSPDSFVRLNRSMELVRIADSMAGDAMIGLSYLTQEDAAILRQNIVKLCRDPRHDTSFWEEALFEGKRMIVRAKRVLTNDAIEINTYEQLRELDSQSSQLKSQALHTIAQVLGVREDEITQISVLKKGMTNRSFLFSCKDKKYIMRIPGEGTDALINRAQEAEVYHLIHGLGLCDDLIYINPENGYKISKYIDDVQVCDPLDSDDVRICMRKLRDFHALKLEVSHSFDLFSKMQFYEDLWKGAPSAYSGYLRTKEQMLSLKNFIDKQPKEYILTHIDANHDNFLFPGQARDLKSIQLIDWEYAGMQDPDLDLAMFCIYALYDREQVDQLIDAYYLEGCPIFVRIKIYCYIAISGLLWSNWCEYKRTLGVEFGEYSLRQYRYAKDYYAIVTKELEKNGDSLDAYR